MKFLVTGVLASSVLLVSSVLFAQAPASKSAAGKGAVHHTAAARPSLLNPASLRAKAPELFKVQFTTTKGEIVAEVHRDWAPLGADRFYNLVKNGFFNNAAFFRVVPNFVVQFGLNPNPAVNKVWEHAAIKDDPVKQSNTRGMLVFATAGPNTRTTQLFINLNDRNKYLDPMGFAPFGMVTQGMDVVDMIYAGYGERPQQDLLTNEGDAYLVKNFPMIDKIKIGKVLPDEPAADKK